jgi:hypothetical protein
MPKEGLKLQLPKMDGWEIKPGVILLGEPTPVEGESVKLRCVANVLGTLCVVELRVTFKKEEPPQCG